MLTTNENKTETDDFEQAILTPSSIIRGVSQQQKGGAIEKCRGKKGNPISTIETRENNNPSSENA